jgi:acyl carrier protein
VNTSEIVRDFITNQMAQRPLETYIDDSDQLVETGIIDSLGVMTLLSFLEEKFSIQIPSEDLIPENFASISTIAALVNQQMHQ